MKQLKYNIIMILLILAHSLSATKDSEVSRSISKNYKVNVSTELDIHSSFGKVHINNWDKNEFDIQIEIIVRSSNEDKAQRIMDRIEIEISESGRSKSFRTDINNINTRNNESFEVNYTVYMPKENPLRVKNSFGDVYVDDRAGEAELEVAYGALKAESLSDDSFVKVSFGSADIKSMEKGKMEIKYSDAELGYLGTVDFTQGFSDVEIEEGDYLEMESKYGSMEIGKVQTLDVDAEFCKFEIGELTGSLDMEAKYVSGFTIEKVAKTFESIFIEGKFGSYELYLEDGISANFRGKFEFSDLRTSGVDINYSYRVKDSNESEYRGIIGDKSTRNTIDIDSSYGDCTIRRY